MTQPPANPDPTDPPPAPGPTISQHYPLPSSRRRRWPVIALLIGILVVALAGFGVGILIATGDRSPQVHPTTHAAAAEAPTTKPSPTPSTSRHPDKRYGQTCKWGYGFTMSVRSASRLTGPEVSPGEALYTVTIRVGNEGDQTLDWPLEDFHPNALIGPHGYAAGYVSSGDMPGLTGALTPGRTETGTFGYTIPEAEAGPQVVVQWMFSDDTEPCTFVGRTG